MNDNSLFLSLFQSNRKQVIPLIDPDKTSPNEAKIIGKKAEELGLNALMVGGSLIQKGNMDLCIRSLKSEFSKPVLIFPGSLLQLSGEADGILFLSLISGRNPELLIGQHVSAAPFIKQLQLQPVSVGYMLIDCGNSTSASYMSHTFPIPYDKNDIAVCTAIAGEMLGLQCIYLDGGSGAAKPVSEEMIKRVSKEVNIPLIVGGGIIDEHKAEAAFNSGAHTVVVGNILEKSPYILERIAETVNRLNS